MKALNAAAAWIWDFVVGDWILVAGVLAAVLLAWATHKGSGSVPGIAFFVVVVVALAVSLWSGTRRA